MKRTTKTALVSNSDWHHRNLTAGTGAPKPYPGGLVGFPVVGTDPRIYYISDDDHHVHEIAYYMRSWHHRDISAAADAPFARLGPLTGFAMDGTNPRVFYEDYSNYHVHELAYYQDGWHHHDLTAASGAPEHEFGYRMAAFQVGSTGARVYYRTFDPEHHVHELAYYQGGWHHHDITALTGAPKAVFGDITTFQVGGGDPRVYYLDSAKHVHELAYYQGGWHHRDISAAAGAPQASSISIGFCVGASDPRVYYLADNSEDVHELAYYQRGWHHRDISAAVDAPRPRETFDVAGFRVGNGAESRLYTMRFWDGHIHEYAYYQRGWHYRDLTKETGVEDIEHGIDVAFPVAGDDSRLYYTYDNQIHELAYYQAGGEPEPEPEPEPATRTVSLERQLIPQGFPPYLGRFPAFGVVPSGRLLKIRVPQVGLQDLEVRFVKPGHSTEECDNPDAVVVIREGETATSAQIRDIFGRSEPTFSTGSPLFFIACIGNLGKFPDRVNIEITVMFD